MKCGNDTLRYLFAEAIMPDKDVQPIRDWIFSQAAGVEEKKAGKKRKRKLLHLKRLNIIEWAKAIHP